METIRRDLHRQFPLHEMFVSPQGHGYEVQGARGPPAPVPTLLYIYRIWVGSRWEFKGTGRGAEDRP